MCLSNGPHPSPNCRAPSLDTATLQHITCVYALALPVRLRYVCVYACVLSGWCGGGRWFESLTASHVGETGPGALPHAPSEEHHSADGSHYKQGECTLCVWVGACERARVIV